MTIFPEQSETENDQNLIEKSTRSGHMDQTPMHHVWGRVYGLLRVSYNVVKWKFVKQSKIENS